MTARINYLGTADVRVITRADILAHGLSDPGADLIWNKSNGFQRNVSNDIGLFLVAQGDFMSADAANYGQALSVLGGSGQVLGSARVAAQFGMSAAGTAEDIPTAVANFTFDGRPVMFETTPLCTSIDTAVAAKLIILSIRRSTDSAVQVIAYREQETALANQIQPHKVEGGPFVAWPSDGVPFVVGQTYTVKLNISCSSGAKAFTNGNTQPYSLIVRSC